MQAQASCKVEKAQESQVCLAPGAASLFSLALVIGLRITLHIASYILFVCSFSFVFETEAVYVAQADLVLNDNSTVLAPQVLRLLNACITMPG